MTGWSFCLVAVALPTGGLPFALNIKNLPDAFLPAGGIVGKCYRSLSSCFSKMSDLFPLSVVFYFPPEVYLSRGVGDLCPLLVRASHVKKISALQFLRGGRVRVTVREPAYREELLSSNFVFEDRKIPVTPAGVHVVTVYVRDLPVELSDETVKSAFSAYGEVYSIRHAYFKDFPELRNGNRLLLMSVSNPIPPSLNVFGFVCRAWHPGQPVNCSICKVSGHLQTARSRGP